MLEVNTSGYQMSRELNTEMEGTISIVPGSCFDYVTIFLFRVCYGLDFDVSLLIVLQSFEL